MKAFGLAFTIWGGTILLCCTFFLLSALFTFSALLLGGTVIGFFVALIITCPLLIPATLLIDVTCKIPYSETVRLCWLGFALVVLDYLFFQALAWVEFFIFDTSFLDSFFLVSAFGLVSMVYFNRIALKDFFSQQTTNNKS